MSDYDLLAGKIWIETRRLGQLKMDLQNIGEMEMFDGILRERNRKLKKRDIARQKQIIADLANKQLEVLQCAG